MNTELLLKLMRMTTSDSDGEALVAIRKANAMLAAEKKDWSDVLGGSNKSPPIPSNWRTPPSKRPAPTYRASGVSVDVMLDVLLKTVPRRHSFYDYVKSVHSRHTLYGSITQKQYEVIDKAYMREMRKQKQENNDG